MAYGRKWKRWHLQQNEPHVHSSAATKKRRVNKILIVYNLQHNYELHGQASGIQVDPVNQTNLPPLSNQSLNSK